MMRRTVPTHELTLVESPVYDSPRAVINKLDKNVIGMDNIKRYLSCLVTLSEDMFIRKYLNESTEGSMTPAIFGPSGSGKTYILKELANTLGVPYYFIDLSLITPNGWSGGSMQKCIEEIYNQVGQGLCVVETGNFDSVLIGKLDNQHDAHTLRTQVDILPYIKKDYMYMKQWILVVTGSSNKLEEMISTDTISIEDMVTIGVLRTVAQYIFPVMKCDELCFKNCYTVLLERPGLCKQVKEILEKFGQSLVFTDDEKHSFIESFKSNGFFGLKNSMTTATLSRLETLPEAEVILKEEKLNVQEPGGK